MGDVSLVEAKGRNKEKAKKLKAKGQRRADYGSPA
jgi:hypothetical protein